jgi:hypothetical protein
VHTAEIHFNLPKVSKVGIFANIVGNALHGNLGNERPNVVED